MIKNVLFDLDGTLLPMDQDTYVKEYVTALATYYAADGFDPKVLSEAMLHGVIAAMKNTSELTNEEIFWKVFGDRMGADLRERPDRLYRFYAEIHPTLCSCVAQGRNSRRPVEILKEKGYRVILATNPLFPFMATCQRMSWAGFSPKDFELVTTYESCHRSKPNPDYFREVCDRLGLDPAECLMVGNDTRDDMAAAQTGMQVYLVTDFLINREEALPEECDCGTFEDLIQKVDQMPYLNR